MKRIYKNRLFKYSLASNIIIVFILIGLVAITSITNYSYVFNYQNENVIYYGNKNSNKVSLMINVYWGSEYIEELISILNKYNVKTTFFVGGSWAEKEVDLMNLIISNGHEIASHGYFHKDHSKLSYEQNYEEISSNHNLIKVLYGIEMNLFAPPSGAFNSSTIDVAVKMGYSTIMWSKDTIDWRDHDSNLIFQRATNNISGGDLILMHPTECTINALPSILEYYKLNNINAVKVSECLE